MQVFGSDKHKLLGLGLVFFAGACFSLFAPAINLATNDQWHALRRGAPHLVVYTAFFHFSLSAFALGFGLNLWFLYRPMAGVPASTVGAYAGDWNGRPWALLAGLLCGFGNGFQFMGGQAAGYAAADAVQVLDDVQFLQSFGHELYVTATGFLFLVANWYAQLLVLCEQALPLVSTVWAVIFFGEYRRSSRKTYLLLAAMLSMFVVAVAVLMASAGRRKS